MNSARKKTEDRIFGFGKALSGIWVQKPLNLTSEKQIQFGSSLRGGAVQQKQQNK